MNTQEIRQLLQNILAEPFRLSEKVLIYGAGNTAKLYAGCFEKESIPICGYVDRDPQKIGTLFQGKPVISVEKLCENYKDNTVLVCSGNAATCSEILEMLHGMHITCATVDAYVFRKNCDSVLAVYDMLCDTRSKEIYANLLLARMGIVPIDLTLVSDNAYFGINEFTQLSSSEVFVDCGAYVGDTLEQYLFQKSGVFDRIFAFEPELHNFRAMQYRIERLQREWALADGKITPVHAGVGEVTGKAYLSGGESTTAASRDAIIQETGDNAVTIYALDDYFHDQRITFLKADVESYEEKMLLGARHAITRDKPKIAVCIYHNASDMYRIPLLIASICGDYHFAVRQHYGNLTDTVLYTY